MEDLWIVIKAAMLWMMLVLFLGSAYDRMLPPKIRYVECSKSIQNSAKKLNITLLAYDCEVTE